jgi:hypothetical protein
MAASDGVLSLDSLTNYEVAQRYADNIWEETLCKRKMEAYPVLAAHIYHQLHQLQTEELSTELRDELDPRGWIELHLKQRRELEEEMRVCCVENFTLYRVVLLISV